MQDAPDRQTLLAGVAMFLAGQIEPALRAPGENPGLAFRSRIAAHLIATVGREELRPKVLFENAARLLGLPTTNPLRPTLSPR